MLSAMQDSHAQPKDEKDEAEDEVRDELDDQADLDDLREFKYLQSGPWNGRSDSRPRKRTLSLEPTSPDADEPLPKACKTNVAMSDRTKSLAMRPAGRRRAFVASSARARRPSSI